MRWIIERAADGAIYCAMDAEWIDSDDIGSWDGIAYDSREDAYDSRDTLRNGGEDCDVKRLLSHEEAKRKAQAQVLRDLATEIGAERQAATRLANEGGAYGAHYAGQADALGECVKALMERAAGLWPPRGGR